MTFDTDALAVWVNGFFALAVVSGVLAIAAAVMLLASARRLPVVDFAGPAATDQAA